MTASQGGTDYRVSKVNEVTKAFEVLPEMLLMAFLVHRAILDPKETRDVMESPEHQVSTDVTVLKVMPEFVSLVAQASKVTRENEDWMDLSVHPVNEEPQVNVDTPDSLAMMAFSAHLVYLVLRYEFNIFRFSWLTQFRVQFC